MAFYLWDQNNPGGLFVMNNSLAHRLYIEADTYLEAENKACHLGVYYNGVEDYNDCECCGDRWYRGEELKFPKHYSDTITFYNVEDYAEYLKEEYGWGPIEYHIYYKDGQKKTGYKGK